MPRSTVVIAKRVEVPAEAIWRQLAVLGEPSAGASAQSAGGAYEKITRVEGSGVGALVEMKFDLEPAFGIETTVLAELRARNDEDRWHTYDLLDCGELPVTDCSIYVRVTPNGPGACSYKFAATYFAIDESDDVVRTLMASHGLRLYQQAATAAGST